jgi:hypothetical protein
MRDADAWVNNTGAEFIEITPEMITFRGNNLGYEKTDLPNYAVWSFRLQLGEEGDVWASGEWHAVQIRSGSVTGVPWGTSNYLLGLKEDVLELQKFGGHSSFGN